jgi:hypothetical protein
MVRDILQWHQENPEQWEQTWERVDKKYRSREYYISALDVKLEGAFVLMSLLYGQGDPDKTMIISFRCGSDSDCNPSSSGGVLFTTMGLSKLPDRYYRKLDEKAIFSHTAYNFPALLGVCEKLTRQAMEKEGGRIGYGSRPADRGARAEERPSHPPVRSGHGLHPEQEGGYRPERKRR